MPPNTPSSPDPLSPPSVPAPAAKKTRWLLYGCGTLIALLLVIVAAVAITRLVDSAANQAGRAVGSRKKPRRRETPAHRWRENSCSAPPTARQKLVLHRAAAGTDANQGQERPYVPGSKVLKLTEREINGLLNANTDLGKSVRLEFATDAINAYVAVPIPQDFPIGGGKMFRARGSFRVSLGNDATPYAILEDITVFGLSLPKAWLGGLKGENLIGQAMGERNGKPVFQGIKSLRVEPGRSGS